MNQPTGNKTIDGLCGGMVPSTNFTIEALEVHQLKWNGSKEEELKDINGIGESLFGSNNLAG